MMLFMNFGLYGIIIYNFIKFYYSLILLTFKSFKYIFELYHYFHQFNNQYMSNN